MVFSIRSIDLDIITRIITQSTCSDLKECRKQQKIMLSLIARWGEGKKEWKSQIASPEQSKPVPHNVDYYLKERGEIIQKRCRLDRGVVEASQENSRESFMQGLEAGATQPWRTKPIQTRETKSQMAMDMDQRKWQHASAAPHTEPEVVLRSGLVRVRSTHFSHYLP
jgi:hypothetical protein